MHNLLKDPLIRVIVGGVLQTATLPETYALLMRDRVDAFPALRAHQRHAWHAFLVQTGVMAMRSGRIMHPPIPSNAASWATMLRLLTEPIHDEYWAKYPLDEPWSLIVDDIETPAFMQPPASAPELAKDYKNESATPDDLDMLVTSKNFEVKTARAHDAQPDDWLFTLINLQTMAGFSGGGNYGIVRMNGGLSNRPGFSLAPSQRIGACVKRDMEELLERDFIGGDGAVGGAALLWLREWDGRKDEALRLDELNPLFVEICRRVRLYGHNGGAVMRARRATSRGPRIDPGDTKGVTGDPWTPVMKTPKESKSLTVSAGGFTQRRMMQWLSGGDWRLPELCKASAAEIEGGDMLLVARALARGQGRTEGYYEYLSPVGGRMMAAMTNPDSDAAKDFASIANGRLEQVAIVQRILSHAIQIFLAGGNANGLSAERRKLAQPYMNDMDKLVGLGFLTQLQRELDADDESARRALREEWLMNEHKDGVVDFARAQLRSARASLPCPSVHRHKADVKSEGMFEGRIRGANGLPFLFEREKAAAIERRQAKSHTA